MLPVGTEILLRQCGGGGGGVVGGVRRSRRGGPWCGGGGVVGEVGGGWEKELGQCLLHLGKKKEKRYEDLDPCLHQKEVAQTFFNERSPRKQTHCTLKRLRVVCVEQT
ncbi:hypothetical protein Hanom_Chr09g00829611 [Helianthus anomalus]